MTDESPLDAAVDALIGEFGGGFDRDYVASLVRTAVAMSSDGHSTLDMKIAASVLREMREAFLVFKDHRHERKVTIFGSARVTPDDPLFTQTVALSAELARRGWMVVTGAGPGLMEAGMVGAGRARSIGVSIQLPFESSANPVIAGDAKFVSMRYFFTRKLMLVKESQAFVCMPGGFGTLDEMFELLTLTQTGKGIPVPIVLMELPGDRFWHAVETFIADQLVPRRLVSPEDVALYRVCNEVEEAVGEIEGFYRNFHSIRFVGRRLVVRLQHEPSDELLEHLRRRHGHLCRSGTFERTGPLPVEVNDDDAVDKPRIAFDFVRRDWAGLRLMIDDLNRAV
ncbi:MAG: TIGR00730 family Rossman fold protein [Actinobacteria bacterium]|nr:TIGR00730 family Rossman fold protein [Actinomycetota bacterium]